MNPCCSGVEFIGCFTSCESVDTGIVAALTGDYVITSYFLGNVQTQTVPITATNNIIFPNIQNESASITIKVTDPNGAPVLIGTADCMLFSNSILVS